MENLNVLRATDAAKYLGVARSTFWSLVKKGVIPQADIHLGSRVTLWRREALDQVLAAHSQRTDIVEKNKLHSVKMVEGAKQRRQNLVKRDEVSA